MKIVVTPLAGGDAITLGDDAAGDYIIDPPPLPRERLAITKSPLFLGNRVFAAGLGNRETAWSWSVARDHGSATAAAAFVWGHADGIAQSVSIAVTDEEGNTYNFTKAFFVELAVVEHYGSATVFRYSVDGAEYAGQAVEQV